MGGAPTTERRAHPRHRVALGATVEALDEPPVRCRTVNVSLGGALLETPTLLGDEVVLVLTLGDATGEDRRLIPIAGDVVAQVLDTKAGVVVARIAFQRMTRGGRARLEDALALSTTV